MPSRLLPLLVTGVLAALIVAGAVLDPVGYFALYGSPGRLLPETGWQAAPLLVYVPLLLAGTAWTAHTFRHLTRRPRFTTIWAGIVLSALVAKFTMAVAATAPWLNLADLAWSTSYTVPKAALYALLPATIALLPFRPTEPRSRSAETVALTTGGEGLTGSGRAAGGRSVGARGVALAVGGVAAVTGPWLGAHWGRDLVAGVPSVAPEAGLVGVVSGVVVFGLANLRTQRRFGERARNRGGVFLGGWLGSLWAGAVLGVVQSVALVVVDGVGAALQTPAQVWIRVG
ncbi:hypothetical protein, partial [Actinocorallia lasiicapitis]